MLKKLKKFFEKVVRPTCEVPAPGNVSMQNGEREAPVELRSTEDNSVYDLAADRRVNHEWDLGPYHVGSMLRKGIENVDALPDIGQEDEEAQDALIGSEPRPIPRKDYHRGPYVRSERLLKKLTEVDERKKATMVFANNSHGILEPALLETEDLPRESVWSQAEHDAKIKLWAKEHTRRKHKEAILSLVDMVVAMARIREAIREARVAQSDSIIEAVARHHAALSRQLRKSVVLDPYGNIQSNGRATEAARFIMSMKLDISAVGAEMAIGLVLTESARLDELSNGTPFDPNGFPSNGHEFEFWLARSLEKFGWTAETTKGSGDQGVDVVASKDGMTIAIQAKCYQSKVGNAAVQEVFSGAAHRGISDAAVITTIGFTASAVQLAATTGVKLLYVSDIPRLDEIFRQ